MSHHLKSGGFFFWEKERTNADTGKPDHHNYADVVYQFN